MIALRINGKTVNVDVEPDTPLLWVLRDTLGMTGTKFGCGAALCGACTVHIDGVAMRSCSIAAGQLVGREVATIESVVEDKNHPVVTAWIEEQVPQCGYCQAGQIMAATALLKRNRNPSDVDIDRAMTNICRCGTYAEIRNGIRKAATLMAKG
ncbi:MAG TPA: (2Fe-2S)-binding protein [Nitrospira sp.]|nr:(2Fe-2S)-binding protein [Nitrospira sp.]